MITRNVVTKADLPVIKDVNLPRGGILLSPRPSLYCPSCGDTCSADPGDYWSLPAGHVFACSECTDDEGANVPMVLVRTREVTIPWEHDRELSEFLEATWNT